MRYAKIKLNDIVNGEGITLSLFTQGCPHHCKGCFNQETWDFDGGKEFKEEDKESILMLLDANGIKRNFSVLGGEPFAKQNFDGVIELCEYIKKHKPETKIYCWSGYTIEQLFKMYDKEKFKIIDVLIDGRFQIDKKDITLKLRGSSNQRVIDIQKTLKENKIVNYL